VDVVIVRVVVQDYRWTVPEPKTVVQDPAIALRLVVKPVGKVAPRVRAQDAL
jgi:hypothetical protein